MPVPDKKPIKPEKYISGYLVNLAVLLSFLALVMSAIHAYDKWYESKIIEYLPKKAPSLIDDVEIKTTSKDIVDILIKMKISFTVDEERQDITRLSYFDKIRRSILKVVNEKTSIEIYENRYDFLMDLRTELLLIDNMFLKYLVIEEMQFNINWMQKYNRMKYEEAEIERLKREAEISKLRECLNK